MLMQSRPWSETKVVDHHTGAAFKLIVNANESCRRLLDIEGVGPISAVLLYATLGSGEAFQTGREFSAYIGLTPKQYSSGQQRFLGHCLRRSRFVVGIFKI